MITKKIFVNSSRGGGRGGREKRFENYTLLERRYYSGRGRRADYYR